MNAATYRSLYVDMVSLREHLKVLHFQTNNYGVHKTVDTFLTTYDALFDRFWETAQSDKFRITLDGAILKFNNIRSYDDLEPLLKTVLNGISAVTERGLLNVCDELAEAIQQFAYLMTFA